MRQGWEVTNIGSIADITDYVANGSFATLRENVSYLNDKGYAILVRLADYTNNFDKSKFVYIDEHAYDFLSKSKLVGGEIIMSNVFSIGKSFICPDLGMPMSLAPNSIVIKTPNNPFYHYLFQSDYFQTALRTISSQTALPKFNKTSFKKIIVPVPPIAEQEKIVSELDCISGIIEKKKQQLKELDNLAQSIFYEMFGDPVENDKGWEVREVGDVCILKSGDSSANNTSAGMLPYIKVGDMNMEGNNPRITTSSTFVSKEENAKGIFPIGSILFPKRGGAIFTNKKRLTSVEVCCDLNIMGVIPKREVLPIYIYHYFIGLDFGKLCNGATIPQINNKDIAPLKICVPSKNKQQEFASKIESIEKQKELIAQSIKETETLFNSRMDYYFN